MSQTLSLYRLQQSDTQIDRAETRSQSIQKILGDDSELHSATEHNEQMKARFLSTEKTLKQAELDSQDLRIKIEQTEASLYNGKGYTPKELLDLQNDVAALKRHLLTLENIQLEAMLTTEETTTSYSQSQVELEVVKERIGKQNSDLKAEQIQLIKELEKHHAERSAIAGAIPLKIINQYEKLRQQKRGLAVVSISEGSCSACGSRLTAAQIQSSRDSKSIELCPSCGRILYGS
jgi:hypothetical protein